MFGDVSTGAQDDLQRATDLARDMVSRYGMSEAIGLAAFERPRNAMFLDVPVANPQEYSDETARTIDAEIRRLLDESRDRVRRTLVLERSNLERVAAVLIAREVIDREEFLQALSGKSVVAAA